MEDKHWKKICKNLIMLKEKLPSELDRIIDYLIQKRIFEFKKKDEIMHHKSNSEKMDKFLGILKTSGPTAYHAFRDALSSLGEPYREVVEALDKGNSCNLVVVVCLFSLLFVATSEKRSRIHFTLTWTRNMLGMGR